MSNRRNMRRTRIKMFIHNYPFYTYFCMYLNQRINHKIKLLKYISEVLLMIIELLPVLHITPIPDYTNEATCSTYHSPVVPAYCDHMAPVTYPHRATLGQGPNIVIWSQQLHCYTKQLEFCLCCGWRPGNVSYLD